MSVNGARRGSNNLLVDDVPTTNPLNNDPDADRTPSIEFLGEFKFSPALQRGIRWKSRLDIPLPNFSPVPTIFVAAQFEAIKNVSGLHNGLGVVASEFDALPAHYRLAQAHAKQETSKPAPHSRNITH